MSGLRWTRLPDRLDALAAGPLARQGVHSIAL